MARKQVVQEQEEEEAAPAPRAAKKSTAVVVRKNTQVGHVIDWREQVAKSAQRAVAQAINTSTGSWIKTAGGRFTYKDLDLGTELECILLEKGVEHAYYESAYDPDNPASPVCFALEIDVEDPEDLVPKEESTNLQNPTCRGCPQFEWGSAEQGRGKACKEIRRLALLSLPDNLTPAAIEEAELAFLKIPVMSVKGIDQYFAHISGEGMAVWQYVTRLKIVPDKKSQYRIIAELAERNAKPLPEKLYNAIVAKIPDAEKELVRPYTPIDNSDEAKQETRRAAPRGSRTPAKRPGNAPPPRANGKGAATPRPRGKF